MLKIISIHLQCSVSCSIKWRWETVSRTAQAIAGNGPPGSRPGTMSSPGHLGFSHPKKIHVTGQDREMGIRGRRQTCPRVPIAEKDIHDQLQACLPAYWLPKEEYSFKEQRHRGKGAGHLACPLWQAGGRPSEDQLRPPNHKLFPYSTLTLARAWFPE